MSLQRIEGILVPFSAYNDKLGTRWGPETDFAFDLFAPHPILFMHGKDLRPHGELRSFEITEAGLFAVGELVSGSEAHGLLSSGRAAWSSGAYPTLIETRVDGFVERWPLVEGSLADRARVVADPGQTDAQYSQRAAPFSVTRSLWTGVNMSEPQSVRTLDPAGASPPPAQQAPAQQPPAQQAPAQQPPAQQVPAQQPPAQQPESLPKEAESDPLALLAQAVSHLAAGQAAPAPPERVLPPTPDLTQLNVRVSSPYDRFSLLGMAMHHEGNRILSAHDRTWSWQPDEAFFRAMLDKLSEAEKAAPPGAEFPYSNSRVVNLPVRAISADVRDSWHAVVPHLRANEAMKSTLATKGDELVPRLLSSLLYYYIQLEARVLSLFEGFMMPSNPFDWPVITSGPTFHADGELTDQTDFTLRNSRTPTSQVGTGKVTFTAGKLSALTLYSTELVEDSGIAFSQAVATEYVRTLAHTMDFLLMFGDTRSGANQNINRVDGTPAAKSNYLAFNGLARAAPAADVIDASTFGDTTVISLARAMGARGKIGRDLPNLVAVVSPEVAYKLDLTNNYSTMDKVGDRATLLVGQVGVWRGISVVVSEDIPLANDAGSVSTTRANNSKAQMFLFHRGIKVGFRRMPQLEQSMAPGVDGHYIRASVRMDVNQLETGMVARGVKITP